jgi:5-methylcytosine-specific restriction protein A
MGEVNVARPELTVDAVNQAMAEFDRLGRDAFLDRYKFGKATGYRLIANGLEYDSKAIVGVAHKFLPGEGRALDHTEFSGGAGDAAGKLRALGFEVTGPSEDVDWDWDEHVLALDLYMTNPASPPGKTSREVLALSALLNQMAERKGIERTDKFRNANGVYMKLMNFRRLDPEFQAVGKAGLSRGAKGEEAVWGAYADDRAGLAAAAAAIRLALDDPTVSLAPEPDDYEADEGTVVLKLHRSRERDRKLIDKKKQQVIAASGRLTCEVCNFDFSERYGELGVGFIEAHHRRPVSTLIKGEKTRLADLALVCANCHRMLHRKSLCSVEALKGMLSANGHGADAALTADAANVR